MRTTGRCSRIVDNAAGERGHVERTARRSLPVPISLGEEFSLTGLAVLERNYLDVYPYDKWSDKEVPNYDIGEIFQPSTVAMEQGSTSAPCLLTEADLITLMDKHGIGTDATHAEHIDKVKTREYVGNTGPNQIYLIPGKLGMGLVEGYDLMGFFLARPNLRSKFEADLELICQGTKQPQAVLAVHLDEYRAIFIETVNQIDRLREGVAKYLDETPAEGNGDAEFRARYTQPLAAAGDNVRACPACDSGLVTIKKAAKGNKWFLGCNLFPTCGYVLWLPDSVDSVDMATTTMTTMPGSSGFVPCGNHHDNTRNLPVNKISVKFNVSMGMVANVFPDEHQRYVVCLYCDSDVCEAINVRHRPTTTPSQQARPANNGGNIGNSGLAARNNPTREITRDSAVKADVMGKSSFGEYQQNAGNSASHSSMDAANNPVCHCGSVTVTKRVVKDGPNKGEVFALALLIGWINYLYIDNC